MDTIVKALIADWKFHLGECEEAWYKGYDDSHWRNVIIPHDWSVEQPFSVNYSSGTGYLAGGIGWYRARFTLPKEYENKSVRIVFDGVYKNSQVWVNSYYLGKRPSGYTSFSHDITSCISFGEVENEVSVKVTHTDLADSRWFTGSGITRKVSLVIEEKVHPIEYGVFFETTKLEETEKGTTAEIQVIHELENAMDTEVEVLVESALVDVDEKECALLSGTISVKEKGDAKLRLKGEVKEPRLWSTHSPNLYKLRTYYTITNAAGNSSIESGIRYLAGEEMVGIRSILFDPNQGFFLNGQEMKLKGVCLHHDGGTLGSAMKKEVWERRLELLKKSGCNAIRCSHNPHMPELYDLCDSMGFLMMDEAFDEWENAKNKWSTGHNVYPPKHQGYFEDFPQWHEADLRAMVRRDRNHPSVIMWSIGNEIDYPNDPYCHPMFETMTGNNDANKPETEQVYDPNKPDAARMITIAKDLVDIVKEEDTTRPVTLAAAFPELSSRIGLLDCLDVVGYNYKEHLYEEDHLRFPHKPFLGSENGHSYENWLSVKDNPYISGQFLWTGIDYLGEAHGWPIRGSGAGYVTTAGFPKPEFYKRQSFWNKEPILHIATRPDDGRIENWIPVWDSWNYKEGEKIIVKCFTNLPKVELLLNGQEVEGCYKEDGAHCYHVEYQPGVLQAKGYDANGKCVVEEELSTTGKAVDFTVNQWESEGRESNTSEVGYLYQLEVNLKDKDGKIPSWDDQIIQVSVCGDGELAGIENGNLSDVTPYCENYRRTFSGKLIVYIRRTGTETIKVHFKADLPTCSYQEMDIIG